MGSREDGALRERALDLEQARSLDEFGAAGVDRKRMRSVHERREWLFGLFVFKELRTARSAVATGWGLHLASRGARRSACATWRAVACHGAHDTAPITGPAKFPKLFLSLIPIWLVIREDEPALFPLGRAHEPGLDPTLHLAFGERRLDGHLGRRCGRIFSFSRCGRAYGAQARADEGAGVDLFEADLFPRCEADSIHPCLHQPTADLALYAEQDPVVSRRVQSEHVVVAATAARDVIWILGDDADIVDELARVSVEKQSKVSCRRSDGMHARDGERASMRSGKQHSPNL